MSKHMKPMRSAPTRSERAKARSAAWNANWTRCARNWLRWHLLTAYDRLLRRVFALCVALATEALRRRKALPFPELPPLDPDDRRFLLAIGLEPVQ